MEIAVLSGKGGTGKTFISTNLADVLDRAYYVDCDIEEPNGHLYFRPENISRKAVQLDLPTINNNCSGCKECVEFCKFNAMAFIGKKPIIFEDICHSCGGCEKICNYKAIDMKKETVGYIEKGFSENRTILTGIMNIGKASGTPIISELIDQVRELEEDVIIDCPPGSACTVMDSIRDADYCILVLEPTLFGFENFKMVKELVELFKKPYGVIINKYYGDMDEIDSYIEEEKIDLLLKIPFSQDLASINSSGRLIVRESREYRQVFEELYTRIEKRCRL